VLALDVPSGLEIASGRLRMPHVAAEATLTLALPKQGLAAPGAAGAVGRLFLADISVPARVYQRLGLEYDTPFGQGPLVELIGSGSRGGTGGVVWTVRLRRGMYRYRCAPHRTIMHGSFSVS
jgi:hypothetical protein